MSNNHSPTNSDYNLYFLSQREPNSESIRPDNVPDVVSDPGFTIDDRPRSLRKETMPGDFSSFQNLRRRVQLSAAVLLPWHLGKKVPNLCHRDYRSVGSSYTSECVHTTP